LVLPWAKRFVVAAAFGFLVDASLIAQLVVAIIAHVASAAAVFQLKPYADYLTVPFAPFNPCPPSAH